MAKVLWTPTKEFVQNSNLYGFMHWVNKEKDKNFSDYDELWEWSISETKEFWSSIFSYFNVVHSGVIETIFSESDRQLAGEWFKGVQLNYTENVFSKANNFPAIIFKNENDPIREISWEELKSMTAKLANHYKELGVKKGDCICSFSPNTPETLVAFLACNAIGATWSSCSPDFGTKSVIDRFEQINPKILFATNSYQYNGKTFSKHIDIEELSSKITSIEAVVLVKQGKNEISPSLNNLHLWSDIQKKANTELVYERVDFNHPMWVLYSSGTTGKPKAITHSYGGITLEHYKALSLHQNVKPGDKFFWFSTTGWMMWNYANSALLGGGTVVIYDGSPGYPDLGALWSLAEKAKINHFGAGASFYASCLKAGIKPGDYGLESIESFGSTGSPLSEEGFDWLNALNPNSWIVSLSGGTDICSGFVGGTPFKQVKSGEIQTRMLGVNLKAYDENGEAVLDELGEMVIENKMPSMPIFFWGDNNNERYYNSYFNHYPNKWRHGDWIKITNDKSIIIYGRSDSTLNRGGVRIGTSEVYSAVDTIEEIADSLVICVDLEGGNQIMPLFVQLKEGQELNEELIKKVKTTLRKTYSPRHVPDNIISVKQIPYTLSGKKMEMPVKKMLMGKDISKSLSKDAMKNPESMEEIYKAYKNL